MTLVTLTITYGQINKRKKRNLMLNARAHTIYISIAWP